MRAIDIERVKPQAQRVERRDDEERGLLLRVEPSGSKSFWLVYDLRGKRRKLRLGAWPSVTLKQAREAARAARAKIDLGDDPVLLRRATRQRHAEGITVEQLVGMYLDHARTRKRSWKHDEWLLRKNLAAYFERPAASFERRDVLAVLAAAKARGATVARNRILAAVRVMFRFAVTEGMLEGSPCADVRAPERENVRDRCFDDDEIATFWRELSASPLSDSVQACFKAQLLTGLRLGEVVNAEWAEIDLGRMTWTIPGERMKAAKAHLVPVSGQLREILVEQRGRSRSAFVFPGASPSKAMGTSSVCRALARNRSAFSLELFSSHDLRRTAATGLLRLGIAPAVVDACLAHIGRGILERHYSRWTYEPEKREALNLWGRYVASLVGDAKAVRNGEA